ncbi:MAG: hypothetical protein JXB19_07645 [Bacteroidales bacterium]|nr:hypothetical protein [Bacteroidales bacterium]
MVKLTYKSTLLLFILTISMFVLSFSLNKQEHNFITVLRTMLERYNKAYHSERAYLLTDRYLYRPGEVIWFQGFVSSETDGRTGSYSEDFYIKLLNNNGEEMAFRRYPLVNNMISGNLSIPKTLIPGKYYMVAYTGWMKNQPIVEAFRKEILISRYFERRLKVDVLYEKLSYLPGDSLNAYVSITDHEGIPVTRTDFDYSIENFRKELIKGTGETDTQGKGVISAIIPETDEILLLTVRLKKRKNMGGYAVYIPLASLDPVISFFPESRQLIRNLDTKVAFKATNQFGLPMMIEGEILDGSGQKMEHVQSNAAGLGIFPLTSDGDSTFLKITYPEGVATLYPLPAVHEHGVVLNLAETGEDSATFIMHSSKFTADSCYLVAVMDRAIVWSEIMHYNGSCRFSIPVHDMDAGILQLTVFDMNGKIMTERLLSIREKRSDLAIYSNRNVYRNRQRVTLSLEYNGPSDYVDLAISVSLDQMADHDNMLGFAELLDGIPDDPSGIFLSPDDQISDLEILTSDLRVIDWNTVLTLADKSEYYFNQDGITGAVVDKKDNPSQLAKVRIISIPSYRSFETQTDDQGRFRVLFGSDIIDFNYLNVEAYDASGKTNLISIIDYDYSERIKEDFNRMKKNTDYEKIKDIIAYGDPDLIYALRYGSGRFRRTASIIRKKYDPYQYRDYLDVLDVIRDIRSYDLVGNKIIFRDIDEDFQENIHQQSALIVINGVLWGDQVDILSSISPSDITNLVISSSPSDIHRYTPVDFAAVIEITTIQGMYRYRKRPVQFIRDLINPEHDFYTPDYSFESLASPDNRKTLYWNTHIQVKRDSPSIISFYTSDIKGLYLSRAAGMDAEGNPVEADFIFSVVGDQ